MHTHADALLSELEISRTQLLEPEKLASDDLVFISGSLVEGLGNRSSDIDVFVIGKEPEGDHYTRIENALVGTRFHEQRTIDYEYWREPDLERLSAQVAALKVGEDGAWFHVKELEFMHRLRIGLPLAGEARFRRWRSSFDFTRLAAGLMQRAITIVDDALSDLCGMLDDGDLDVGLLRTRDLLDACCDAYLHARGETNTKSKWRARLLARMNKDALGFRLEEAFWSLQCPEPNPRGRGAECAVHIERCIRFANTLIPQLQG